MAGATTCSSWSCRVWRWTGPSTRWFRASSTIRKAGPGALGANPLVWLAEDPKPLLLIFDGLDEVARPDGAGLEVTQRFLGALRSKLDFLNGGGDQARLMALALGRPQAAEESVRGMGGLDDRTLLHVAPLRPLDEERFSEHGRREVIVDDPGGLAGEDHREAFWRRYRPFDPTCRGEETPEALGQADLAEMTSEPLLLYLLLFSGLNWREASANRNGIYQAIFEKIHERDLKKPHGDRSKVKMGLEKPKDFFALMECLGLAAWQGGGRTGTDQDFSNIRDRVYITRRGKRFEKVKSAELRNVAVQTFTHQGDGDQPGYAFIHKSFGEYLTARALIAAGDVWLERDDDGPGDFVEDWLQLTAWARLTADILRFMVDEAKLRSSQTEIAREKVKRLELIAKYVLQHGLPAHNRLKTFKGEIDWRHSELAQRNAEEALYALIHAWAEAGYPFEVKEDGKVERDWEPGPVKIFQGETRVLAVEDRPATAYAMLRRVGNQWIERGILFDIMARWDLSGHFLRNVDFQIWKRFSAELGGTNFCGAKFRKADLAEVDLRGAYLIGASLLKANLIEANLSMANLRGADLSRADLSRADLSAADLSGADLSRANLSDGEPDRGEPDRGAPEDGVSERGEPEQGEPKRSGPEQCGPGRGEPARDLIGVDLSGADLRVAPERGGPADLYGVDLCGANCSGMNIRSARLESADLSKVVNLRQEQIDSARTAMPKRSCPMV